MKHKSSDCFVTVKIIGPKSASSGMQSSGMKSYISWKLNFNISCLNIARVPVSGIEVNSCGVPRP